MAAMHSAHSAIAARYTEIHGRAAAETAIEASEEAGVTRTCRCVTATSLQRVNACFRHGETTSHGG